METDSIRLSPKTIVSLSKIFNQDFNQFELPERMAFIVLQLRKIEDNEILFPMGKWATIQSIESQLAYCVEYELTKIDFSL